MSELRISANARRLGPKGRGSLIWPDIHPRCARLLRLAHLTSLFDQRRNPVFGVRVRREKVVHAAAVERVDNVHRCAGGMRLGLLVWDLPRRVVYFPQRRSEPQRALADLGAIMVGAVFARTAEGHLNNHGRERRYEDSKQGAGHPKSAALLSVTPPAEEHTKIRDCGDRACNRRRHRHRKRIVVLDMSQLMGQHACNLFLAQRAQKARGGSDRRVVWIAARGERIRLLGVDDINTRHRQIRIRRELPHNRIKLGRAPLIHLLRVLLSQHHLVRVPIGERVCGGGDYECNRHACGAADRIADRHEKRCERGEQEHGAEEIHGADLPSAVRVKTRINICCRKSGASPWPCGAILSRKENPA